MPWWCSLAGVFEGLPSYCQEPVWPDAPSRVGPSLLDIPREVFLDHVLPQCGAKGVASAAATCRLLRALCSEACPSLDLVLYPHQVTCSWAQFQTKHAAGHWVCGQTLAVKPLFLITLHPGAALLGVCLRGGTRVTGKHAILDVRNPIAKPAW